ncbi:type I-F CRISPR-associated protein Csy3 [Marinobacter sp. M3C]|jgi:CRISPR-associated protein Csy3|uniref:type I-F CRISPR-associated protein Csy3 n=1 Tax=unclassified Marinobacter TaxID=83889 RepID=UPI00200D2799|nr:MULTISPECIES: type I-F CRISPR-associated protein Csy3 [unclassified Marinobacter]MCL1478123.1 type I-F CRISPR-associated protein Csy3 [Marinobacter sp.]MCL1480078.1 type I-F CRISPR-associated protein Csy3 [Marinobacter sp.]MCL1484043.1 type I-F CRISPR-associated protein Csy3 [Marinobacter sp.]MCL1487573.1 type I-F CRISPR-associated protein Csy3 [Marinobacter sp.]UQG55719.1 type I-F CRISPR-associated protein Csy3 [Marinobacter sp. M4C]
MTTILKKLPAVASFNRASVISDGRFFSIMSSGEERDIPVIRHGIRGTQNTPSSKKGADKNVSNIQITESAKTDVASSAFGVEFMFRFLPLGETLSACSGESAAAFRDGVKQFAASCENSDGLKEVSRRFARNILNGRWLWRNRTLSDKITISVESPVLTLTDVDAFSSSLYSFNDYSDGEQALGEKIAESLSGKGVTSFQVRAIVDMGFKASMEVYPSQNYVQEKPTGFARPLYKIGSAEPLNAAGKGTDKAQAFNDVRKMGIAALRDQKIGNALRTIDTWYPAAELNDDLPISVEPEGANLDKMTFFRNEKSGTTAFVLAPRLGEIDPDTPEGMFMIAALIRGGVYSEKKKKDD